MQIRVNSQDVHARCSACCNMFGRIKMNWLEFISSFAWPLLVLVFLIIFRESIGIIIQSIKKFKYKSYEIELSDDMSTGDNDVDILVSELQSKSHSFKWLRSSTPLTFSDEQFEKIINDNPKLFKSVTIHLRKNDGSISEKRPGMKYIGSRS